MNRKLRVSRDTKQLEDVMNRVFITNPEEEGGFRAIVGAHQAGKTMLRDIWHDNWIDKMRGEQKGIYYVSVNVACCHSSLDIWRAIAWNLQDQLNDPDNNPINGQGPDKSILDYIDEIKKARKQTDRGEVFAWVFNLFKRCKTVGIHAIIVLDEVNSIVGYDKEDKQNFFDILQALQNDSKTCGVSILLLSQIGISDIIVEEENSERLKAFIQKYPQVRLEGFDYLSLSKWYFLIRNRGEEKRELSPETIGRMHYYCGRFPGLLGVMGEAVFENSIQGIDRCYEGTKVRIHEIYDWFAERLKAIKFLSSDGEISGVDVFLQTFVGPDFETELELDEWMEVLYEKGLVERPAERPINMEKKLQTESVFQPCHIYDYIAELLSTAESEQKPEDFGNDSLAKKLGYEPVSPCFIKYLQKKTGREEEEEIRRLRIMLRNVERTIRRLIYEAYLKFDRDSYPGETHGTEQQRREQWERVNNALLFAISHGNNGGERNAQKVAYWESKKSTAEAKKIYDISPVDMLSFSNYYELIVWTDCRETRRRAKCWEEVRGYLSCYQKQGDPARYDGQVMKEDFEYLREARNNFMHDTPQIDFSEEIERKKLRDICTKILESVKKEEERRGGAGV